MKHDYGTITPEIVEELREIIGERNVIFGEREKLETYAVDETGEAFAHLPDVVAKPETTDQVSKLMALANKHKIPVTPRGAGSGLAGSAVPIHGGIVLSTERMNKVLEIDKTNRVAVVEPGVVTKELCVKVLDEGLMYAGYPMSVDASFVGGNVGTNAGGGKVIKYGNTRMHVLGLEVVLPSGEVIRLGGKYRKETWGYNLLNLMIGSEGTLGIFTRIILNLIPPSGKTVDLLVPFDDVDTAVNVVSEIVVSGGVIPVAVEYMDKISVDISTQYLDTSIPFQDKAEAWLIIQLEGKSEEELEGLYEKIGEICLENGALDVFVADSRTDSENIWKVRQVMGEAKLATDPHIHIGDIIVPLSEVPETMREMQRIADKYDVKMTTIGHIGDGNLHTDTMKPENVSVEDWHKMVGEIYDEIIGVAVKLGGVGSGEHGIGIIKRSIFLKTKSQAELALMRGIKQVFDPNYILNPGKIF